MSSIDNIIAEIIGCPKDKIGYYLEQSWFKTQLLKYFEGTKLITLYNNRLGMKQEFNFNGFSFGSARNQYAYQKFMRTTVYQHFYARHKILLEFPDNPCLKHIRNNGHIDYYPLELIGLKEISQESFLEDKKVVLYKAVIKPLLSIKEEDNSEITEFMRKGDEKFNYLPTPTSSKARESDANPSSDIDSSASSEARESATETNESENESTEINIIINIFINCSQTF